MSLFSELRRRNVFRVATAYVVTAWLVIQVVETIFPIYSVPDSYIRVVITLLGIGLVPALVFAWAFELTPEGLKKEKDVDHSQPLAAHSSKTLDRLIMVVLALALGYFAFDKFILTPQRDVAMVEQIATQVEEARQQGRTEALVESYGDQSIAVLPFVNMSSDEEQEYFSDGISEELLNLLAKVPDLRVISRSSAFSFKGKDIKLAQVAQELKVAHILEGSVRKAGNRVRIAVQLIEARSDTQLWSETYDRQLVDIFAIQDEIAARVVEQLKVRLLGVTPHVRETDTETYTLFLQGRYLFQQRNQSLLESEKLLRRAVELDPDFAEAWALLAMNYSSQPAYVNVDSGIAYARAMEAANRALSLDPGLAEASLAIAQVDGAEGRINEALFRYDDIIERHPKNSIARLWFGIVLLRAGYAEEAHEHISVAANLDPAYGLMLDWNARSLLAVGKLPEALQSATRAIQLGRTQGRVALMYYLLATENRESIERFLAAPDAESWTMIRWVLDVAAHPQNLSEALAKADQLDQDGAAMLAEYARFSLQLAAGNSKDFFAQMRQVNVFDDTISVALWMPAGRRHRQDPEMKDWVAEMNLQELWQVRGWPDYCHPVGTTDFSCN